MIYPQLVVVVFFFVVDTPVTPPSRIITQNKRVLTRTKKSWHKGRRTFYFYFRRKRRESPKSLSVINDSDFGIDCYDWYSLPSSTSVEDVTGVSCGCLWDVWVFLLVDYSTWWNWKTLIVGVHQGDLGSWFDLINLTWPLGSRPPGCYPLVLPPEQLDWLTN